MNIVKPFTSIELAVRALLLANYQPLVDLGPAAPSRVDSDLAYDRDSMDWYIRIQQLDSRTDRFEGDFVVDIEVFSSEFLDAESRTLDIEALLLGYPHVVEVDGRKQVFDTVSQNTGFAELPWEDDEVSRLGATYVITRRR